jgi:hypothetical protein
VPVSAEMVPGQRSKFDEVTEPGRAAEQHLLRLNKTFDNLPEYNETTFLQPFTVFVSLGQFVKKFKKNVENLTLDNTK